MAIKIAINGYGRIGRNILRALYERKLNKEIQIVAINDTGKLDVSALLTKYDSTHGRFPGDVEVEGGNLIVNGDGIKVFQEKDPAQLPWKSLGIDVVLECTGLFTSKEKASLHLQAGARKVLLSAPGKNIEK